MYDTLKLRIFDKDNLVFQVPLTGPLELGRQQNTEPDPYQVLATTSPPRLIVATKKEVDVFSRQHIRLEPLPSGQVRVSNFGKAPVQQEEGATLDQTQTVELRPPFSLHLGMRRFEVSPQDNLMSLDNFTMAPSIVGGLSARSKPFPNLAPVQLNDLVGWLQTTMTVLQSTVVSTDFLTEATRALVRIVGLHSGRILLRDQDAWTVAATHGADPQSRWKPSQRVIDRLLQEKKTFYQNSQRATTIDTPSLQPMQMVVASPILDGAGEVRGVLYGERRMDDPSISQGDGKVEALLVELLAYGVASGLLRQEQERDRLKVQLQFEQFFTKQLAEQLRKEPNLLQGKQAEVTLLFCDLRNFSGYSSQIGPTRTFKWIGEVMTELSRCVLAEEGVLVDYIGDELVAMWGAPAAQEDQAVRAVRAALAMVNALPGLNATWEPVLGGPMDFGIGLNTGPAQVGNTGSEVKFKYGPLGDTVNVASRIQGLTKFLRCRLLMTANTWEKLGPEFIGRRVVKTRLVNIDRPFDLYEVGLANDQKQKQFFQESEEALGHLEEERFTEAARGVGALLRNNPGDGPLILTLSRAANMMMEAKKWDPVWTPPGK